MLQRVQTLFMTIAAVSMVLVLFFPIWEMSDQNYDAELREYAIMNSFELRIEEHNTLTNEVKVVATANTIPISIGAVVAALVMFWSITRYKNRMTQVKLNSLFSLIISATLVGIIFYVRRFDPQFTGSPLFGGILIVIAMINNMIANRFIRKDERLVKSMDRIR